MHQEMDALHHEVKDKLLRELIKKLLGGTEEAVDEMAKTDDEAGEYKEGQPEHEMMESPAEELAEHEENGSEEGMDAPEDKDVLTSQLRDYMQPKKKAAGVMIMAKGQAMAPKKPAMQVSVKRKG